MNELVSFRQPGFDPFVYSVGQSLVIALTGEKPR